MKGKILYSDISVRRNIKSYYSKQPFSGHCVVMETLAILIIPAIYGKNTVYLPSAQAQNILIYANLI